MVPESGPPASPALLVYRAFAAASLPPPDAVAPVSEPAPPADARPLYAQLRALLVPAIVGLSWHAPAEAPRAAIVALLSDFFAVPEPPTFLAERWAADATCGPRLRALRRELAHTPAARPLAAAENAPAAAADAPVLFFRVALQHALQPAALAARYPHAVPRWLHALRGGGGPAAQAADAPALVGLRFAGAAAPSAAHVWHSVLCLFRERGAAAAEAEAEFCVLPDDGDGGGGTGTLLVATWSGYQLLLAAQLERDARLRQLDAAPASSAPPRFLWAPQYVRLLKHWYQRTGHGPHDCARRRAVLTVLARWCFAKACAVDLPLLAADDPLFAFYDQLFELLHKAWPTQGALHAAINESFAAPQASPAPAARAPEPDAWRRLADEPSASEWSATQSHDPGPDDDDDDDDDDGSGDDDDDGDGGPGGPGDSDDDDGESRGARPTAAAAPAALAHEEAREGTLLEALRALLYAREPHEIRISTLVWLFDTVYSNLDRDPRIARIRAAMPGAMDAIDTVYRSVNWALVRHDPARMARGWHRIAVPAAGRGRPAHRKGAASAYVGWREGMQNREEWDAFWTQLAAAGRCGREGQERWNAFQTQLAETERPRVADDSARLFVALALFALGDEVRPDEARRVLTGLRVYDRNRAHQWRRWRRRALVRGLARGASAATARVAPLHIRHTTIGRKNDWEHWHRAVVVAQRPLVALAAAAPGLSAEEEDARYGYAHRTASDRPDVVAASTQLLAMLEYAFHVLHRPRYATRARLHLLAREVPLVAPAAVWQPLACALADPWPGRDVDTFHLLPPPPGAGAAAWCALSDFHIPLFHARLCPPAPLPAGAAAAGPAAAPRKRPRASAADTAPRAKRARAAPLDAPPLPPPHS